MVTGAWLFCFAAARQRFPVELGSQVIPVAIAACRLAKATHAKIVGDEGEEYPLLPGAEGARKSG